MEDVRIDSEGNHRCWKCGGKNFTEKRTARSKMAVGVGALMTHKKLKCQDCGEYNDTGNAKPFVEPEDRTFANMSISERVAARKAGTLPKMTFKEKVAANKAAIETKKAAKHHHPEADGPTSEPKLSSDGAPSLEDPAADPSPFDVPMDPDNAPSPVQASSETQTPDPADQLRRLADLHGSGLITDEEFAAKRAAVVELL
jgi:hypothetical protein